MQHPKTGRITVMPHTRSRGCAFALAVAAATTLALLPDQGEASGTCLPKDLKARLQQVKAKFGSIEIISTYRRGARMPNGQASFHASCRAVDFKPPSGKYGKVASWLKSNHGGGVGTYSCGMHHIHIDNGPRVRFHHCQRADGGPEHDGAAVRSAREGRPTPGTRGARPRVLPDRAVTAAAARL
jgi:hypothetical protein